MSWWTESHIHKINHCSVIITIWVMWCYIDCISLLRINNPTIYDYLISVAWSRRCALLFMTQRVSDFLGKWFHPTIHDDSYNLHMFSSSNYSWCRVFSRFNESPYTWLSWCIHSSVMSTIPLFMIFKYSR